MARCSRAGASVGRELGGSAPHPRLIGVPAPGRPRSRLSAAAPDPAPGGPDPDRECAAPAWLDGAERPWLCRGNLRSSRDRRGRRLAGARSRPRSGPGGRLLRGRSSEPLYRRGRRLKTARRRRYLDEPAVRASRPRAVIRNCRARWTFATKLRKPTSFAPSGSSRPRSSIARRRITPCRRRSHSRLRATRPRCVARRRRLRQIGARARTCQLRRRAARSVYVAHRAGVRRCRRQLRDHRPRPGWLAREVDDAVGRRRRHVPARRCCAAPAPIGRVRAIGGRGRRRPCRRNLRKPKARGGRAPPRKPSGPRRNGFRSSSGLKAPFCRAGPPCG